MNQCCAAWCEPACIQAQCPLERLVTPSVSVTNLPALRQTDKQTFVSPIIAEPSVSTQSIYQSTLTSASALPSDAATYSACWLDRPRQRHQICVL